MTSAGWDARATGEQVLRDASAPCDGQRRPLAPRRGGTWGRQRGWRWRDADQLGGDAGRVCWALPGRTSATSKACGPCRPGPVHYVAEARRLTLKQNTRGLKAQGGCQDAVVVENGPRDGPTRYSSLRSHRGQKCGFILTVNPRGASSYLLPSPSYADIIFSRTWPG